MGRGSTASGAGKADASRLRMARYTKKYRAHLEMAQDEGLCLGVWALHTLQSGRPQLAAQHLRFPPNVVGARLGDPNHVPPWILESLVNARFALGPFRPRSRGVRQTELDTASFAALSQTAVLLRAAEDAEQGVLLERYDVIREMARLLQRQFEWGRGFVNGPQVYRSAALYSGEETRAHFEAKHGLTIADFILFGFALSHDFGQVPVIPSGFGFGIAGLSRETCMAALKLMTLAHADIRPEVARLRGPHQGNLYQPSLLRRTPVLAFGDEGERLRAPLPELIMLRVTSGLFYDLLGAPSSVRNEVGDRFETYVRDLFTAGLPELPVAKGGKYRLGKRELDLPDVLMTQADRLAAVIECKARKMPFAARFGERPEDEPAVEELVKGVLQLWRFFAHARLKLAPGPAPGAETIPMLLTLENWTQMNRELQTAILERARSAAARDPHIAPEDQRPVVFASIEDLETTLERSDEDGFLKTLKEAATERFVGWMLPNVFRDIQTGVSRPYPLSVRMGEVLPWWTALGLDRPDAPDEAAGPD